MTPAKYVAVDLETTTLDVRYAVPVEIAAIPFDLDDPGVYGLPEIFVPAHDRSVPATADPAALAVNRYYERRLWAQALTPGDTDRAVDRLLSMLDGATLVAANPAYDSAVLWSWLSARRPDLAAPPWNHRLFDVSLATAVALNWWPIPGLASAAGLLGLDYDADALHSAAGDAFLAADVCTAVHALLDRRDENDRICHGHEPADRADG